MMRCEKDEACKVLVEFVDGVLQHLAPKVSGGLAKFADYVWDRMVRDDSFRGQVGRRLGEVFEQVSSGVGKGVGAAIGIVLVGGGVYLRNKYFGDNEVADRIGLKAMQGV